VCTFARSPSAPQGYGDNAYHNSCHGADVALSVHRFLVEYQLLARLTKLDILAALVAAMAHDFNHPCARKTLNSSMRARHLLISLSVVSLTCHAP
jgi:hypothetical protein